MEILMPILVGLFVLIVLGGAAMLLYAIGAGGEQMLARRESPQAKQKRLDDARYAKEWDALTKKKKK